MNKTRAASKLTETTDLGIATVIVELEDGQYEPVGVVSSIREAREVISSDKTSRKRRLALGESPLCPFVYRVWARRTDGEYRPVFEIYY